MLLTLALMGKHARTSSSPTHFPALILYVQ